MNSVAETRTIAFGRTIRTLYCYCGHPSKIITLSVCFFVYKFPIYKTFKGLPFCYKMQILSSFYANKWIRPYQQLLFRKRNNKEIGDRMVHSECLFINVKQVIKHIFRFVLYAITRVIEITRASVQKRPYLKQGWSRNYGLVESIPFKNKLSPTTQNMTALKSRRFG